METQTEKIPRICQDCKKEFSGDYGTLKSWKGVLCPECYPKRFSEIKINTNSKRKMLNAMNKMARNIQRGKD